MRVMSEHLYPLLLADMRRMHYLLTDKDAGEQEELELQSAIPSVTGFHKSGADSLKDAEAGLSTVM